MNSNTYKLYCLSYNNPERKMNMESRFQKLNLPYVIYDGVSDSRIQDTPYKIVWSCMYGHLDMIKMFYEDDSTTFGIFCEDDIYIHKDFSEIMPNIKFSNILSL
jgi:hypothetical protein